MTKHNGQVLFGQERIMYDVIYLKTSTDLYIEVHPDKTVVVKAPQHCGYEEIARRVLKRAPWICRQLRSFDTYKTNAGPRQYIPGESHRFLGRQYRLKIIQASQAEVWKTRTHLIVTTPCTDQARVKKILTGWYRAQAKLIYQDILENNFAFFQRLGHAQPQIHVRTMCRRWGSLSNSGVLTLNSTLIHAARECIEYVVIHELCHLQHKNHGAQFMELMEQRLPDWERRKKKLEESTL